MYSKTLKGKNDYLITNIINLLASQRSRNMKLKCIFNDAEHICEGLIFIYLFDKMMYKCIDFTHDLCTLS